MKPSVPNRRPAGDAPRIISAIGSPLTASEQLHDAGLEAHLEDQWANGIDGILVAGTMGLLQLLRDDVYQALCRRSAELAAGRGEVLVGAGDCSYVRTLDRIEFLNTLPIDGVVVLTPYFLRFSQPELIEYFTALADASRAPLFLYDLPQRTGSKIELATALRLAEHPNIRGIKCSDEPGYAREVRDATDPADFRVVVAQPTLVDALLRWGFTEHLDGLFAMAPRWSAGIARCASEGDWDGASALQRKLIELKGVVVRFGPFQTMTAVLNARGVPGNYAPRPLRRLSEADRDAIAADPCVAELVQEGAHVA